MVCPPTYGDGGGPWSGTRTVRQMAGSALHKKVQRGAGEACSVPTLPSLLLSRPQVTALPAPLPQRLCLGSLRPFQAWSSLTFTPASPIPDKSLPLSKLLRVESSGIPAPCPFPAPASPFLGTSGSYLQNGGLCLSTRTHWAVPWRLRPKVPTGSVPST